MKSVLLEIQKQKRTGIFPLFLAAGLFAGLYETGYFLLRRSVILSFGLQAMSILIGQIYGVICALNMFLLILAAAMLWHTEFVHGAIKKMAVLPFSIETLFPGKFTLAAAAFALTIALEFGTIALIGVLGLPEIPMDFLMILQYAGFAWISSLGVLSFMLFISSRTGNLWICLGAGVLGFLSGMSLVSLHSWIILLDPFAVMFKPAVSLSAGINPDVILASSIQTAAFLGAGCLMGRHPVLE